MRFSFKPYKCIRYATGIVIGACGELCTNPDLPNPVPIDYSTSLVSLSNQYPSTYKKHAVLFMVRGTVVLVYTAHTTIPPTKIICFRIQFKPKTPGSDSQAYSAASHSRIRRIKRANSLLTTQTRPYQRSILPMRAALTLTDTNVYFAGVFGVHPIPTHRPSSQGKKKRGKWFHRIIDSHAKQAGRGKCSLNFFAVVIAPIADAVCSPSYTCMGKCRSEKNVSIF